MARNQWLPARWSGVVRTEILVLLLGFFLLPQRTYAECAGLPESPTPGSPPLLCVEPVHNDLENSTDPELDQALRAVIPLVVTRADSWKFAANGNCAPGSRTLRFVGHRQGEVRYTLELVSPDRPTTSLTVDSKIGVGAFAVAEALCVNALLLLGEPIRSPVEKRSRWMLWVGPSMTLGNDLAVEGSEIGARWIPLHHWWVALHVGFEGFGTGSNPIGRYQYSMFQFSFFTGWMWRLGEWSFSTGVGLRQQNWLSHLQTTALHQDYDVGLAVAGELRAAVHVRGPLRLGLALRPSWNLPEIVLAPDQGPDVFRVPHLLLQTSLQIAVDL